MSTTGRRTAAVEPNANRYSAGFSPELRAALEPWIELSSIDSEAFESWLLTILPLLPRPAEMNENEPGDRIHALSLALVHAAQERAVSHFQAAEYFRDNQMLARRVRALEAMVRASKERGSPSGDDGTRADVDRASERYLPRERRRE